MGRKRTITVGQILLCITMFLFTLTILIPLLHILARSISDPTCSSEMGGLEIIPKGFSLINYQVILSNKNLVPSIFNSIFITLVGTALNIGLTIMAAYALTRPGLIGKKLLMAFFIVMMLFDPGIVPEYLVIKSLRLMGSQWSVILCQSVNVYYLVIMMRYFEKVPQDICEAAQIDGAGHLTILFDIIMPLAEAGIATITMFYAVLRWNEYYRAGIYISNISKVPLQVILRKFVVAGDTTTLIGTQNLMNYDALAKLDYTALQYATIVVAIIPILLIYPAVLKFYNKDVMAGGVKG
ncbi:carbohydrate ABC transporter permease [Oribacterium sp. WCC10]|uniref:carbohydrate ABC transporter permease n=1 Tax=Oribacterium sp. WCC10 TaxID=1855343 RepID=UPI0008E8F738|nr:carbohydrate ABC transporter permease [Oribacterium sp. WCC10]SFG43199.1 carbohydrate ABC transporter membrane protein 2, CUT1 family [Oribacterium sp. WCC10]